jgi:hypothetical protein
VGIIERFPLRASRLCIARLWAVNGLAVPVLDQNAEFCHTCRMDIPSMPPIAVRQIIWKGAGLGEYAVLAKPRVADRIVHHRMLGTLRGTDVWFAMTPAQRKSACSSADYGIGLDGTIHQYVKESDESYAEGINFADPRSVGTAKILKARWGINPNLYSYSIEHEGFSGDPWPEAMRDASAWLTADIAFRHGIPLDRDHILGHGEIYAPKALTCPGPTWPADDLIARAKVYLAKHLAVQA